MVVLDEIIERVERVVVQQVDEMLDNSDHNQSNGKSNGQSKGQSISKCFLFNDMGQLLCRLQQATYAHTLVLRQLKTCSNTHDPHHQYVSTCVGTRHYQCNYDNMRGIAEAAGAWNLMIAHHVCASNGQTCAKLVAARMQ